MIDPNWIAEAPDDIKANLTKRHAAPATHQDVDRIVELSELRRRLVAERDDLRAQRNSLSKEIGTLFKQGRPDEAAEMKAKVAEGNARIEAIEGELEHRGGRANRAHHGDPQPPPSRGP